MAKNEILPFGIADGANVLPAEEYQKLTARNNGFSAGGGTFTGTQYCLASVSNDCARGGAIYCRD
ncbi:hypothetical protein [Arsenophonus endosymbiont of Crataerina pallida]|uniref:hypothetical protein n=1 Tax=Arsenophonus endosymbiont of Crataerina pallida TaxID=3066235 RepID=UPI0030CB074D